MLVSEANRLDHAAEKLKPLADGQLPFVAPAMDWLAIDKLHHEKRPAFFCYTCVKKFGDIRMVE